jgi:hypothetical protein
MRDNDPDGAPSEHRVRAYPAAPHSGVALGILASLIATGLIGGSNLAVIGFCILGGFTIAGFAAWRYFPIADGSRIRLSVRRAGLFLFLTMCLVVAATIIGLIYARWSIAGLR